MHQTPNVNIARGRLHCEYASACIDEDVLSPVSTTTESQVSTPGCPSALANHAGRSWRLSHCYSLQQHQYKSHNNQMSAKPITHKFR